ncbi:hypothetical protein [Streptomyces sp. NPDC090445]|uniref:hypothetical protein n=1 Tax=Streptomyces sp. NPDC090445 TaxID=3365963 RepID=UPI0037F6D558
MHTAIRHHQPNAPQRLEITQGIPLDHQEAREETGHVAEAARAAGADGIVEALPRGYDTTLGCIGGCGRLADVIDDEGSGVQEFHGCDERPGLLAVGAEQADGLADRDGPPSPACGVAVRRRSGAGRVFLARGGGHGQAAGHGGEFPVTLTDATVWGTTMSMPGRLITAVFLTSVLSGMAAPLASTAYAATSPGGIGWDTTPTYATVAAAGTAHHNGIGWD